MRGMAASAKVGFAFVVWMVLLVPGVHAQDPPDPETEPSISLAVSGDDGMYNPNQDPRQFGLEVTVVCAATHIEQPTYNVAFNVLTADEDVTAIFSPSTLTFSFEPGGCLTLEGNNSQMQSATLSLSTTSSAPAFSMAGITFNATLHRTDLQSETMFLGDDEGSASMMVTFLPGLGVNVQENSRELVDGGAMYGLSARSTSNGPSTVTAVTLEADSSLSVSLPAPFELAAGGNQTVEVSASSPTGCPTSQRSFSVEFTQVTTESAHAEHVGTANKTLEFFVTCDPKADGGGIPGPPAVLVVAATLGAALVRKRKTA